MTPRSRGVRVRARRPASNRRLRRGPPRPWRRLTLALAVPLGAATVFLGARAAVDGDLFRVREVTFRGLVNARPAVLVAEAGLGRRRSIFDDLEAVEARLARDPLVRSARVRRELPGRLVVDVREREPVAYWSEGSLWPVDAEGRVLPLAPAYHGWDLPILMGSEAGGALHEGRVVDAEARALLRLVLGARDRVPEVARRISVAQLGPGGDVLLHLMEGAGEVGKVRLRLETPLAKLGLLPHVLRDLEAKGLGFEVLDLSYADQIVVRPVPLDPEGARRAPEKPAELVPVPAPPPEAGPPPAPGAPGADLIDTET